MIYKLRRDIQFLRGIAVLVVVIYHSRLGLLSQGYLGVDVFFVLSGFLITSLILKELENNTFSFSQFYLRRAKRLLPALYSTLLFTTLFSLIILTKQWLNYLDQLIGALTFSANMVLPAQSGYFESASEGKPLLHIWSLSLEEQYYFFLPITLYLLPKKYRLTGMLLLLVISIYWCISWVYSDNPNPKFLWRVADATKSEWAFFLLFTRAWELLAGSLCAWLILNKPTIRSPNSLKVIALIGIFVSCGININNEHPSIESIIVVILTMIILIDKNGWLPSNIIINLIEKIGDWSYSIYLVHWPLFAFAYLSYVGDAPISIKLLLLFSSIFLGYLQYKYIETPFRNGKFKNAFASWKVTIATTATLLFLPVTFAYINPTAEDEFSHLRRHNPGLGMDCEGSFDKHNTIKPGCILGENPKIVIWGDSYAMHLEPGLSVKNKQLIQITKSVCGPIMGLAPITTKHEYDTIWAKTCLDFNESAFEYIKNSKNITHVVLSANFSNYFKFDDFQYLTHSGAIHGSYEGFVKYFNETILALKKLNITPIIFSPLPKTGFNVGECLERMHSSALLLRENCDIVYNDYLKYENSVINALKAVEDKATVIWLKDYLCNSEACKVYINNTLIYRDSGHLSVDGSISLLSDINIRSIH